MISEYITLHKVDDEQSKQAEDTSLYNIKIELSASVSKEWQMIFDYLWKQNIYLMKCDAEAFRHHISIICLPDELHSHHVPELKRIVTQTNSEHEAFLQNKCNYQLN